MIDWEKVVATFEQVNWKLQRKLTSPCENTTTGHPPPSPPSSDFPGGAGLGSDGTAPSMMGTKTRPMTALKRVGKPAWGRYGEKGRRRSMPWYSERGAQLGQRDSTDWGNIIELNRTNRIE